MKILQSSTFDELGWLQVKLGVAPGSSACVEVSQMISSTVGLVFAPATSGDDAFPLDHVRFSHGLSIVFPSVDVKTV